MPGQVSKSRLFLRHVLQACQLLMTLLACYSGITIATTQASIKFLHLLRSQILRTMSLRNRQDDACILSSARTHSMASDRYDSAGWWPGATRHPGCYLHGRRLHSSFFWSSPHVLVWTVRISCALASHCSLDHPHLWKQQKHNQHCTQQQHTLSLGSNHGLAALCSLQVHVRRPSFR